MTDNDDKNSALRSLLEELCNDTLSEERHELLKSILASSNSARIEYLEYVDLHLDLKRVYSQVGDLPLGSSRVLSFLGACTDVPDSADSSDCNTNEPGKTPAFRAYSALLTFLTLAASLFICFGLSWVWISKGSKQISSNPASQGGGGGQLNPPAMIKESGVRIAQVASAKFFGDSPPRLGSSVQLDHEYALSGGMIELQFPSGASAIIESPAIFEVASESKLVLTTGTCSVHAPDGAQGFEVDTPVANVIDLGTRFVVNVAQTGEASVQVVEGEAEVFTKGAESSMPEDEPIKINLREKQAKSLMAEGSRGATDITYDESSYKRGLPDRIVSFNATEDSSGAVDELLSVTVQRGGRQFQYEVGETIGINVIHFTSQSNAFMTSAKDSLDVPGTHLRSQYIDRDRSLCSGLINPGGALHPLTGDPVLQSADEPDNSGTQGMGIRFRSPVKNAEGPDVVCFEIQTIVNAESGDFFHVSPLKFKPGLRSFSVDQYDIDLVSPQSRFIAPYRLYRAETEPRTLMQLLNVSPSMSSVHHVRAKVLAVGIDLSDLGYSAGESVEGLFLQDALDDGDFFDPVFVAGLPPTP